MALDSLLIACSPLFWKVHFLLLFECRSNWNLIQKEKPFYMAWGRISGKVKWQKELLPSTKT